ncbi:hypothetical protein [Streptomyces sp. GbtcB6]|uniref:hypothetical protein n=1 Tax=Streptomyces sp. GbtcB6 TaxID=2824751 RepID=UPI001C2FAB26|nr:hypothetical protein [Streptomyces sp. GbtcB6]
MAALLPAGATGTIGSEFSGELGIEVGLSMHEYISWNSNSIGSISCKKPAQDGLSATVKKRYC